MMGARTPTWRSWCTIWQVIGYRTAGSQNAEAAAVRVVPVSSGGRDAASAGCVVMILCAAVGMQDFKPCLTNILRWVLLLAGTDIATKRRKEVVTKAQEWPP